MNCLLDTCALLWLADDPRRLPSAVRDLLTKPATVVQVSAVSALELGIQVARKKLRLPLPVSEWFPAICSRNDLPILPIDAAIAAASTELPDLHRDPFDRLLVATALERRLVLVTPNQTISQYPTLQTLW